MLRRTSLALWTIPVAGVFAIVALSIRGPLRLPVDGSSDWLATVSQSFYMPAQILLIVAYFLPFFGFVAIYRYLSTSPRIEPLARLGLVFSLMGTALALPALGIVSFVAPALGQSLTLQPADATLILTDSLTGPGLFVSLLAGILYTLGPLFLGVAIWRSEVLSKAAALLFASHGILLSLGFSMFPALILGWTLLALSGICIIFVSPVLHSSRAPA
jgi:hypothetical protein